MNNPLKYVDPSGYFYDYFTRANLDWAMMKDKANTMLNGEMRDCSSRSYQQALMSAAVRNDWANKWNDTRGYFGPLSYAKSNSASNVPMFGEYERPAGQDIKFLYSPEPGYTEMDGDPPARAAAQATRGQVSRSVNGGAGYIWSSGSSTGATTPVLAASEQGDGKISMDASHNRIGFVPLDVGKNYGAYQMANYRSNISVRGNQSQISVWATSSNTPVADGQVVFRARASLVVNGNTTQTQNLENGLVIFKLQSTRNVSLTVNGGWTVYYDYGGAAIPVYHPIFWPFSLNFTDNFKLK